MVWSPYPFPNVVLLAGLQMKERSSARRIQAGVFLPGGEKHWKIHVGLRPELEEPIVRLSALVNLPQLRQRTSSTTPNERRSVRASRSAPRACSGDMYATVPTSVQMFG